MASLENEGIVLENALSIEERGSPLATVRITGFLRCRLGVVIRIEQVLQIRYERRRPYARGVGYGYHAWLAASGQPIIRYDDAHEWIGLHCHLYDLATGEETALPTPPDQLPTLDGFVRIADKIARDAQG